MNPATPIRRGRSHALAGVGVVVLSLVLVGCGDDPPELAPRPSPSAATSVSSSPESTVGVRSLPVARSAEDLGKKVAKAVRRERTATVRMVNDGGAGAGTQSLGTLHLGKGDPAFSMSLDNPAQPMTMVAHGSGLFMRLAEPLDGKNWLKLTATLTDVEGDDAFSGIFAEVMDSTRANIDIAMIAETFALAKDFEVGDVEQIDGTATTRYTLTLGEKALRKQLSQGALDRAGAQMKGASGTLQIFVDADWLPRKVVNQVRVSGRDLTSTVSYSDWGTADPVDPPPAADVADVADYPDTSEIESKLRAEM